MKHNRLAFFISILIFGISHAEAEKQIPPETTVQQFYEYHLSHDMGFTEEAVKQRSPWLTPELLEACRTYFAIPQNPDEPPYINGDPFTGTQEYPETFSVGSAKTTDTTSNVELTFHWKEAKPRTAIAVLKKSNEKWLIDDIEFRDQESLRQMVKMETK